MDAIASQQNCYAQSSLSRHIYVLVAFHAVRCLICAPCLLLTAHHNARPSSPTYRHIQIHRR